MEFPEIKIPYICLLVSGGHSMIVDVKERGDYEILGQSQDDAVGEAIWKIFWYGWIAAWLCDWLTGSHRPIATAGWAMGGEFRCA